MTKTAFIRWNDREDLKLYYLIIDTKTIAVLGAEFPDFVDHHVDPLGNDRRRAVVRLGRIPDNAKTAILSAFEKDLSAIKNSVFSIRILSREEVDIKTLELGARLESSADAGAEHWRRLRESAIQKLEQIDKEEFEQTAPQNEQTQDAADQSDTANDQAQAAGEQMERELANIHGRGATGRRRKIMKDKYHLTVSQIWEFENPGSVWRDLLPGEKHAYTNTIEQAIKNARSKK